MRVTQSARTTAQIGTFSVVLTAFVLCTLYFAQDFLIPIALAALLTFLLSPLADYLERWIGRILAVLLSVGVIVAVFTALVWLITNQLVDLAAKLPDYKDNIQAKLRAFEVRPSVTFKRFTQTLKELRENLPGGARAEERAAAVTGDPQDASRTTPVPVQVVQTSKPIPTELLRKLMPSVLGPLGTATLVLLLLIFMLLKREDLRSRLIRLIGQGRLSATTRAMEDASRRVSRYLFMQLMVNVSYGIPVAVGLYFIGVPNAPLWGLLATALRFIPYVGPWVAAGVPVLLSLAVFDNWTGPLLTISLFIFLELISNNVIEPWLYGSSTGVSSIALIISAIFWTWLWGPIGLVLATPLTVCLAVMGRHVPRLQFLSVLLSDEQALTPYEECYQRLLAMDVNGAMDVVETYLKSNSMTALYDNVLLPVIVAAEMDRQRQALDEVQLTSIHQNLREIITDLEEHPPISAEMSSKDEDYIPLSRHAAESNNPASSRVLCLPAGGTRDELTGTMLAQLLNQEHLDAVSIPGGLANSEMLDLVEKKLPDAVCISVVPPSTIIHARYLSARLRQRLPMLKIVVGLWGATDNVNQATQRLTTSGANETATSLTAAVQQVTKLTASRSADMTPAEIPADEEKRLLALSRLDVLTSEQEPTFDRVTKRVARIYDVPIALITFIDRDRQFFKSQVGLPEDLARSRSTPRAVSLCGHVVAKNKALVVENLQRDRRFANNPVVRDFGLRFYAGVPLRATDGQPVGSLCIMDTKPRQMTEQEMRVLEVTAEELMEEVNLRFAAIEEPKRVNGPLAQVS